MQQANTLEEKELLEWMDCLENCVWQTLWEDVGPALFLLTKKAWEEEEGRTPKSWATGLIRMIPKDPSKEAMSVGDLGPSTLLESDYKIGSKALAWRLRNIAQVMISKAQKRFHHWKRYQRECGAGSILAPTQN